MFHANLATLHEFIARKWDQLSAANVYKPCYSFCCHLEAVVEKNGADIE